jgi:hypothetical protein
MKRTLLWMVAGIVLVANAWALITAWQNRRSPRGGSLELTERELPLMAMPGESTVTLLRIEWDTVSDPPKRGRPPAWLNQQKLTELGFDCTVTPTAPGARHHYGSLNAAPVFLVLEYEGDAWRQAQSQRRTTTRLYVVDAGRDADRLRARYREPARYVIVRGLVRPFVEERIDPDGPPLPEPRIRGSIQTLLPSQIFVPRPHNRMLQPLQSHDLSGREEPERDPRFAVNVSWGTRHEPWITAVRLLDAETPAAP